MSEVEYPRWVYPPDGGPGCVVQTPDDRPKGWLDTPSAPGAAMGERVIGQPVHPVTPATPAPGEDDDDKPKKSKKA